MTKAQWTDFLRAILKSKGRYISLIFIVALGTAFFTGVRSAEPDMTASADRYYDETSLMDVRILGTLGLTEDDLEDYLEEYDESFMSDENYFYSLYYYSGIVLKDYDKKI